MTFYKDLTRPEVEAKDTIISEVEGEIFEADAFNKEIKALLRKYGVKFQNLQCAMITIEEKNPEKTQPKRAKVEYTAYRKKKSK